MKNYIKITYNSNNSNKGLDYFANEFSDVTCTHSPKEKWIDEGEKEIYLFA